MPSGVRRMFHIVHNGIPTGLFFNDKAVAWLIAEEIQHEEGGTVTVELVE